MRFCANPNCRFHEYRVKSPGQPLVVNRSPMSSVEACALKEIVSHHAYCKDSGNTSSAPVYFCDVCHRAIEMAHRSGLSLVSGSM